MADSETLVVNEFESPPVVSKMSVVSLVLSLVFCCPLTSFAGIVTGLIGLFASGPRVTGRWLAVLGILLGIAGLSLQGAGGVIGYRAVVRPILIGPQEAIIAGQSGDIAAFRSAFIPISDAKGGSEDAAKAFIQEVTSRYGTLKSAALDQNSAPAAPRQGADDFEGEYLLDFAQGRIRARCTIEVSDQNSQLTMKIISIEILDSQNGNLVFPAPVEGMP
jgi:hypothetical protein